MDEFSFKKMRMLGQPVISSCCLCVRCKSRELGDGVGVAGESKIPGNNGGQLLCSPSNSYRKILDRLTFRILSNINDKALQSKYVEHF